MPNPGVQPILLPLTCMTPRFARLSLALSALAVSPSLFAQTPPPAAVPPTAGAPVSAIRPLEDRPETLKLVEGTVDSVLDLLTLWTGRVILRPGTLPPVAGGFTIKIERPTPRSEIILYLLTLLKQNGIGVTPMGDGAYTVVPLGFLKNEAPEMIEGSTLNLPPSGKIATKIFQLDFLRVGEFVPLIQNTILTTSVNGGVVMLAQANSAMITDTVSNLQRVETLLKQLDRPATSGLTPKSYTLRNGAKSSEVVSRINSIIRGPLQTQLGTSLSINADDRSNQIILIADPRQYPFFDNLIQTLDIKADPNTRMDVIPLKYADAKEVASLLSLMVSGQTAAAQRSNPQSLRPGQIALPAQPNIGVQPGSPVGAAPIAALPNLNSGGDAGSGGSEFSALATIQPDTRGNSLIVSGTVDDLRLIRELISKIDIVLPQVRIEVIIAEVTLTDSQTSGITALGFTVGTDAPNNPLTGGDNGRGTHITGIDPLNVAGWNITKGIVNPLSFQAALTDNGKRSNVKILQAPTIVTTHNKKATIRSGSQVPVVTASTATPTNASTTGITTQSQVTYKDIVLKLDVTPLIGDDGSIQMTIDQTVDDVIGNVTIDGNDNPLIGTRQATSFVTVGNDQMIVLGGLQRTKASRARAKIGFFYEIPILSQLLGGRSNSVERTELLLFIRPHVIKLEDASADTAKNIGVLSNKEQIQQFLTDPSKPAKESVIEKLK